MHKLNITLMTLKLIAQDNNQRRVSVTNLFGSFSEKKIKCFGSQPRTLLNDLREKDYFLLLPSQGLGWSPADQMSLGSRRCLLFGPDWTKAGSLEQVLPHGQGFAY